MKFSFSHVAALTWAALTMTASAQQPMNSVTLIDSNKVAAAFAKGGPMLETGEFKIQAGHRDGPRKRVIPLPLRSSARRLPCENSCPEVGLGRIQPDFSSEAFRCSK